MIIRFIIYIYILTCDYKKNLMNLISTCYQVTFLYGTISETKIYIWYMWTTWKNDLINLFCTCGCK